MPDRVQFVPIQGEIGTEGGTLQVSLADTTFSFPAGTFGDPVVVTYTVRPPSTSGDLVGAGPFFDLSAAYLDTGQPAQIEPGQTYTVTIHYTNIAPVAEETLGLYGWDEGAAEWSQEGISNTVDPAVNLVTAEVDHLSLFALLGETRRVYLPLVLKNH
jgi:hypothetical protein